MSDKEIVSVVAGLSSAVYVEDKPINKLRFSRDENGCLFYNSDVKLLLNAERLRNLIGEEGYLSIVRSITPPAQKPIHDQLSDRDLILTTKSRFLQAPSEVKAWFEQMEYELRDLVDNTTVEKPVEKPVENSDNSSE